MSKLLDEVVSELSRLPGIGRRTAMRLAMHLLRMEPRDVELMSESISRFRTDIRYCCRCNNLSDDDLCEICADTARYTDGYSRSTAGQGPAVDREYPSV